MCEAHTQRGTEASFFNAFWPWEGFWVLYPAGVWPNSGLEFVLSLSLSLFLSPLLSPSPLCSKTELSPSHALGPEAERKNREKMEGDEQAGVAETDTPTRVA